MDRTESRTSFTSAAIWSGVLLAALGSPASAEAQFGRLKNMVAGVTKGEVYGLDVTQVGSPVVFVVDLTPVIELPPDAVENVRQMVAQEGEDYVRRKLAEEGPDWALRATGPAGLIAREAWARRNDRAERARNHVRAGIEGLDQDQRFGLVTFEGGAQAWRSSAAVADEANREEAREFVGALQKVEGDGFLRSALMAAAGLSVDGGAYGSAGGASDLPVSAAMAPAVSPPALVGPASGTVSTENLLWGIELALELDPEAVVIVVGATSADDPEFVAQVDDLLGERQVTIHSAVFGEDQPGGILQALAEANGGRLLTAAGEEE